MLFDDQLPGFLEYEADKDTVEALLEKKEERTIRKEDNTPIVNRYIKELLNDFANTIIKDGG